MLPVQYILKAPASSCTPIVTASCRNVAGTTSEETEYRRPTQPNSNEITHTHTHTSHIRDLNNDMFNYFIVRYIILYMI